MLEIRFAVFHPDQPLLEGTWVWGDGEGVRSSLLRSDWEIQCFGFSLDSLVRVGCWVERLIFQERRFP
jgi:hypothetical protein